MTRLLFCHVPTLGSTGATLSGTRIFALPLFMGALFALRHEAQLAHH